MSSNTHLLRQPQVSLAGRHFRCFLTWFFFCLLLLYIVYTSKLILLPNSNCPPQTTSGSGNHRIITEKYSNTTNDTSHLLNSSRSNSSFDSKNNNDATSLALYGGRKQQVEPYLRYPMIYEKHGTKVEDLVFCIAAASNLWERRKEYIKIWWRPNVTRGVVWLDQKVRTRPDEHLPETRVSGDTARFRYTNPQGQRSALRLSRAVSETLRLGVKDVKWFVMGDDDTVFAVDNLVRVLSKYDHTQFYYIGSSSESHIQNIFFSYGMAFGGGGFAISYPLAKELEKMQDRCIQRYPGLYGSDDRIQACMAELGVPLSKEPGFHQFDVYGNLLGLLGAHPVTPLVSLHHLDVVDPVFPGMTKVRALQHLFHHSKEDYASMMQQSICYDKHREWSITVSWGYVVQIVRGVMSPRELEMPTRTFLNWYTKGDFTAYAFNTRPVTRHPCQKPFVYYIKSSQYNQRRKQIVGIYNRYREDPHPLCRWKMESPDRTDTIVVVKRPDNQRWQKSPRKDCCRVIPSNKRSQMHIWVGSCREGEISEL